VSVSSGIVVMLAFVLGMETFAQGQDTPGQDTPTQQTPDQGSGTMRNVPAAPVSGIVGLGEDASETASDLPTIPAMLGGKGTSLALPSELERSNYLRGGVNFSAGYNDNALLLPSEQIGNTTFSVFPNIAIAQSTSRMRWSLGYAGGLTVNQRLSNQDSGSHNLMFDSLFRLSPHVNLHASENFSLVSGLFGGGAGSDFQPGTVTSNSTLITPLANQTTSWTVVEANYHFALKDLVGASGSYYTLSYGQVAGSVTLENTQTSTGTAFWLHETFRGNWAGASYSFQHITYDPDGETNLDTISFVDTFHIGDGFHVSGFLGPQYFSNQGIAATGPNTGIFTSFTGWGVAGGVDGGWRTERSTLTAGYSRTISDGAGILGAVRLGVAHAAVRRELFSHWAATLSASYGSNNALTLATATTAPNIGTTSVGVSVDRDVSKSVGFKASYFHDWQDQSGSTVASENYNANRNRFLVTLSYQWAKPLGR
jgi:hypothetical protein